MEGIRTRAASQALAFEWTAEHAMEELEVPQHDQQNRGSENES